MFGKNIAFFNFLFRTLESAPSDFSLSLYEGAVVFPRFGKNRGNVSKPWKKWPKFVPNLGKQPGFCLFHFPTFGTSDLNFSNVWKNSVRRNAVASKVWKDFGVNFKIIFEKNRCEWHVTCYI